MKKAIRYTLAMLGFVLALGVGYVMFLRFTAPAYTPLTVDPVVALNAAHTDAERETARLYQQAAAAIPEENAPEWRAWRFVDPSETLPPQVEDWVLRCDRAILLALQASQRESYWLDLTWDPTQTTALDTRRLQFNSDLRKLAQLVHLRHKLAIEKADWERAGESLKIIDGMGRHTLAQPLLIDVLTGQAILGLSCANALDPMRSVNMTPGQIIAYVEAFSPKSNPLPPLTPALQNESTMTRWSVQKGIFTSFFDRLSGLQKRLCVRIDRNAKRMISWAQLPTAVLLTDEDFTQILAGQHLSKISMNLSPAQSVSDMLLPAQATSIILRARAQATQDGTLVALAAHLYRARHGQFPDELSDITDPLPDDPFTGKPFIYRKTEEGFILYSAGLDGDDDGGAHDPGFGQKTTTIGGRETWTPDGDYVFWPPQ